MVLWSKYNKNNVYRTAALIIFIMDSSADYFSSSSLS